MTLRKRRGIRNNNPGNIRENDQLDYDWKGEAVGDWDAEFEEFSAPEYGIRAMYRILKNYRDKYGLTTIPQIINRWAPPTENDTDAYIESVAKQIGIQSRDVYVQSLTEGQYIDLIKAIIYHENGRQPYSDELIKKGMALA